LAEHKHLLYLRKKQDPQWLAEKRLKTRESNKKARRWLTPKYKNYNKQRQKEFRALWRGSISSQEYSNGYSGLVLEGEIYAKDILERLGFTELFRPYPMFFVDWIATKDGQLCFIEVTFSITKPIKTRKTPRPYPKVELVKRLHGRYFILFIRPCNFEHFILKEVDLSYTGWRIQLTRKEIKQSLIFPSFFGVKKCQRLNLIKKFRRNTANMLTRSLANNSTK